jgi:YD repeat-containing protein
MIVYAPNGTTYEMTEADGSYWHAKRITDRFGNSMTLSYVFNTTAGRKVVSQVSANDGRLVTFSYAADKLNSVSGGGVVWTYSVQPGADGSNQLMQVTPPVGGSWQYAYNGNMAPSAGSFMLNQMINPLQGIIQYSYALVNFLPNISGWAPVSAIRQKVAGANVWTFSYSPGCGSGINDTTTVSLPTGDTIQYKHFGYCNVNSGDVWKIGLLYQKFMGSVQSETFTWTPQSVSDEVLSRPGYAKSDTRVNRALLSQRNVMRDGVGYNTTYAAFDSFGNPQSVQESGNASRSKSINYFNSASAWILGVRDDETITGAGTIARSHGVNGELLSESPFGVTTTFAYNYDGTLSSKTTAKPASTSFSNYLNGVARTESRPQGVVISRNVDALGRITSQTDGEFTWTYGYDGIGRVTSIGFPAGANATISWTATSKTLTRGGLTIATHFDAFGNATRVTRGGIATSYDYDGLGRKTFESLPGSLQGSTYTYDVLGRITRIQSPAGTRTIQYSGNSTTVTDERGKSIRSDYALYGDRTRAT